MDIHINVILPPNATLPSFSTYLPRFQQMIGEPGKEPLKLSTLSLGGPVDQLSLNGVRQFIDRGVDVRGKAANPFLIGIGRSEERDHHLCQLISRDTNRLPVFDA